MAYDGGIDFLDLPPGGVHWLTDAITSPWATSGADAWHTGDGQEFVDLKAQAWGFTPAHGAMAPDDEMELVFDTQDMAQLEGQDLMCVVLGMEKKKCVIGERAHFVLVIAMSKERLVPNEGNKVYERVGVGQIKGKYLDKESSPKAVTIR